MMKFLLLLLLVIAITSASWPFQLRKSSVEVVEEMEDETCGVCCSLLEDRPTQNYTFYVNTGHFVGGSDDWDINTYGYSGNGSALNNPNATCEKNLGPAPATDYQIALCTDLMHVNVTKPCSFALNPLNVSEMCGRDDIYIHGCECCTSGDETAPPAPGCSLGCIIIPVQERMKLRVGDYISVRKYEADPIYSFFNGYYFDK